MPIHVGGAEVSSMSYGSQSIREVYLGAKKIWPPYTLVDHFTSSTGAGWLVSGTRPTFATYGTAVEAGNGNADVWSTKNVLTTHLSRVEHLIYHTSDRAQKNAILMGNTSQNVYVEYSVNDWRMGYYDGTRWTVMASGGAYGLVAGSVVALERVTDTTVRFLHNGTVLGTGTMPSNVARGLQTGFSVKAAYNVFVWWRSPAIDAIRVIP